jgi:hypothetical protein
VLVVHSALTRITDMLEKLLVAASAGAPDEALKAIEDRHRQLTTELGLDVSAQLQGYFDELRQMANGIALVRELSDRTRARVMANGELMATEIGARFLESQGVDVTWMDARDMLFAEPRGASAKASVGRSGAGVTDGRLRISTTDAGEAPDAMGAALACGTASSGSGAACRAWVATGRSPGMSRVSSLCRASKRSLRLIAYASPLQPTCPTPIGPAP